jgi:hypothetical protein
MAMKRQMSRREVLARLGGAALGIGLAGASGIERLAHAALAGYEGEVSPLDTRGCGVSHITAYGCDYKHDNLNHCEYGTWECENEIPPFTQCASNVGATVYCYSHGGHNEPQGVFVCYWGSDIYGCTLRKFDCNNVENGTGRFFCGQGNANDEFNCKRNWFFCSDNPPATPQFVCNPASHFHWC